MSNISVLILAAGKGVRMKSNLPKVLHPVGGTPMVERVLKTVSSLQPAGMCVIIGHRSDEVRDLVRARFPKTKFATQRVLDGSGGAVRQALAWLRTQRGDVIVTCGDAPLIRRESFQALLSAHRREGNVATVFTAKMENPFGYGRIVRSRDGAVERIVEELDATPVTRDIKEINTGTYVFDAKLLAQVLPKLQKNNAKKEYYLTDTLELLRSLGGRIGAALCDADESLGINQRSDLAKAEAVLFRRKAEALMAAGVTLIDPATTFVAETVSVGPDTILWPQTYLLGRTVIGAGCVIGPWAHITDCHIENGVKLQASFAEGSVIRKEARVGPYSRIRPGSDIGPGAHLGNFTEVKKTRLGAGAKANHLAYLGDAKLGKNVNIGAGSITCNYDGHQKHPTTIEDHAFIGSNVNLIAPVRIGAHAVVGAGSSVNENVPPWALAVERAPAVVKKNWAKLRQKKRKK